jgi:hypothetical protein
MPKGSGHSTARGGKSKRGRRRYQARRPIPPTSRQVTPSENVPADTSTAAPAPSVSSMPRAAVEHLYLSSDLKRIGIIAGALLIVVIVLSRVL